MKTQTYDLKELALAYHRRLPEVARKAIVGWGIPDPIIHRYRLGWDGEFVTIPITDRNRRVAFFKGVSVRDPSTSLLLLAPDPETIELYGWERLLHKRDTIVICDGEIERLVLEAQGVPAVTSTGDPLSFRGEWTIDFAGIANVVTCFRPDEKGVLGTARIQEMIPRAAIVDPSPFIGASGSLRDFFVGRGKTVSDFSILLREASTRPQAPEPSAITQSA